jgi:hypothetical protein
MDFSHGLRHFVALMLVVVLGHGITLAQQPGTAAAPAGQSQLKWTPHRAATSPEQTSPPAAAPRRLALLPHP